MRMKEKPKRNNTIDFLKCYAALIVFVCHAYIVSKEQFGFEFTHPWQFVLKTPAWAGVWIFVMVSGFLAGSRFWSGKYELNKKGILQYYKDRFINVVLPAWVMVSLVYILSDPQVPSAKTVIEFITCLFRGSGAAVGVGATWYVFSISWLYLLTPLFLFLLKKTEERTKGKKIRVHVGHLILLTILGLAYRVLGRMLGLTWYRWIYASPIGNIDLFFSGMIINRLRTVTKSENAKVRRILEVAILFASLVCSYCYFYGETTRPALLSIYRYLMPTAYIFIVGGILLNSRESVSRRLTGALGVGAVYSFQFYLWHSLVMTNITRAFSLSGISGYVVCLLLGAVLTGYIAFLMTRMQSSFFKR